MKERITEYTPKAKSDPWPESSTSSTSSTGVHSSRIHPIPTDSILEMYLEVCRDISEAPDPWLIAPIITLCGRLLTPNVYLDFAGNKPMTIYNFIAGPAGMRKSTTFTPAEQLAKAILDPEDMISGNVSDSALFGIFQENPHRLQFEDEGNTILKAWAGAQYGREVAARYLKLYDGGGWQQSFLNSKKEGDVTATKTIDLATLSLCIGSTFGVSKLDGIDAQSGLRRRFGYYVATRTARLLSWPKSFNLDDHGDLLDAFRKIKDIKGRVGKDNFTLAAMTVWERIQRENREMGDGLGHTKADEIHAASITESPARILKLAVIFQVCRWAAGVHDHPLTIDAEVLEIAEAHQLACLEASRELETVGKRSAIHSSADTVIACIRVEFAKEPYLDGTSINLDKSTLTRRFAANPSRAGGMTTDELYHEIIPALIRRGEARAPDKEGKKVVYAFKPDQ